MNNKESQAFKRIIEFTLIQPRSPLSLNLESPPPPAMSNPTISRILRDFKSLSLSNLLLSSETQNRFSWFSLLLPVLNSIPRYFRQRVALTD